MNKATDETVLLVKKIEYMYLKLKPDEGRKNNK